jgi:predicted RNA-binding Zn-ribbon protein involved in translation (DUF1610 family)
MPFFADGTEFVEPIDCTRCGQKAYLVRRTPHPTIPSAELRTFGCPKCGLQIEQSEAE